MKTVFIGGSRAVSRINAQLRERLNNVVSRQMDVVLGDANGADKAVQRYFAEAGYPNVTVYCMGSPRNNLGDWPTRSLNSSGSKRDFNYYSIKDRAMAEAADCGFMLWDGVSKGTFANIGNLLLQNKAVLIYFSPKRSFWTVKTQADLRNALEGAGLSHSKVLGGSAIPPKQQQHNLSEIGND